MKHLFIRSQVYLNIRKISKIYTHCVPAGKGYYCILDLNKEKEELLERYMSYVEYKLSLLPFYKRIFI